MKLRNLMLLAPLTLLAPAALAKEAPDSAAITAHGESLMTENYLNCTSETETSPLNRIVYCKAAIDELEARRRAAPKASAGIKGNFDFFESVVQSSLAVGYVEIDKGTSARLCTTIERIWALRLNLRALPEQAVPADAYVEYQKLPKSLTEILTVCRAKYGTSAGAPPLS